MRYDSTKHHRRSIRLKGYDYSQPGTYFVTICAQNRECLFGDVVDGTMVSNDAGQMIETWYNELEHKFPGIVCGSYVIMPNHMHFIITNVGADQRVCPELPPQFGEHRLGEHAGSPQHICHEPQAQLHNNRVGADLRVCPAPHTVCPEPHTRLGERGLGEHAGSPLRVCPEPHAQFGERGLGERTGSPLHRVVQWFKTMTTNAYIRGVKQLGWVRFDRRLWQRNYYERIIRDEDEWAAICQYITNNPAKWEFDKENPNVVLRDHHG